MSHPDPDMDPRAFLKLAERLLADEKNPEGFRSTISRAYYATFNVAAEFLNGIGCEVPADANGHKRAYYYLNNCGDQLLVEAAGDLENARRVRNAADYRMDRKDVENEPVVRNWVDTANRVIARLDECNVAGQRKTDVIAAMRAYKKQMQW